MFLLRHQIFNNPKKLYTKLLLNARPPKNVRPIRLPTNEKNIKTEDMIHELVQIMMFLIQ
jgi:ABC-type dipeptide/oligopeptide/nickel transport system ATPase component